MWAAHPFLSIPSCIHPEPGRRPAAAARLPGAPGGAELYLPHLRWVLALGPGQLLEEEVLPSWLSVFLPEPA